MALKFGTDGVRGRAHTELTTDDVAKLAQAAARALGGERFIIGSDTRESGPDFVDALCRGFAAEGVAAESLGIAPTPAVAWLASTENIAGAMVSASHNPFHDNGIKFFAAGGRKLTDEQQTKLEAVLVELDASNAPPATGAAVDRTDAVAGYVNAVADSLEGRDLSGQHIVLDCANGASAAFAPGLFERLGAQVTAMHTQPDGQNINNNCGSTHMESLSEAVVAAGADFGLAFDGDADRVLAIDNNGNVVDGDHIIGVCAHDLKQRGSLADNTVVVTVMTNLGFRLAMESSGIVVHETGVGDRHVLAALEANSWTIGGEQSGHVIFHEIANTGDGMLTGVHFADAIKRSGKPLDVLAAETMTQLPQVLENVRISGPTGPMMEALAPEIAAAEAKLGRTGRILVRPSGTEPLIRVMAEAETQTEAQSAVDSLVRVVEGLAAQEQ